MLLVRYSSINCSRFIRSSSCSYFRYFSSSSVSSRTVSVRGIDFHVQMRMEGPDRPVLLCLPGALGTARTDFGPFLDDGIGKYNNHITGVSPDDGSHNNDDHDDNSFSIISFDPRGLGRSNTTTMISSNSNNNIIERDYPIDFYARDALDAHAIMEELGHSKYSLLGWSDGAIVALHMASSTNATHKNAIQQMVLWGGQAYITQQDIDNWEYFRDVRNTWSERMMRDRSQVLGGVDGEDNISQLQRINDRVTDTYQQIFQHYGGDLISLQDLHRVTCPTLIIHGAKDPICHQHHAAYIARQIVSTTAVTTTATESAVPSSDTNSNIIIIPEGKHNLHIRHKHIFDKLVIDFIHNNNHESGESRANNNDDNEKEPNIENIAYAFMSSKALSAGLKAGVFDAIHEASTTFHPNSSSDKDNTSNQNPGTASFQEIEQRCTVKGERLKTLISACVAINLIHRKIVDGQDAFKLPKASQQQLCRDSGRFFWGDYISGQVDAQFYRRMADLDETLITGNTSDHGYEQWFESDPQAARRYTEAQHNGSLATGFALWKRLPQLAPLLFNKNKQPDMRILDVGGGSGAFSIAAARKIPEAKAVVLDLPNVITVAEDIIEKEETHVRDRLSTIALSATSPDKWKDIVLDASFDVVLMSYVSGSIPATALSGLYTNAFRALRPGGIAVIHDFFVDNNGRGPKNAALWALAHVTVNPEGMGLRPNRLVSLLSNAGFVTPRVDDLIPGATQVIVAKKPL